MTLLPLLDFLVDSPPSVGIHWRDWRITPVHGGANNRVFRATSSSDDVAVKFVIRDSRDRAGREFEALQVLEEAGLALAPKPLLLDRSRYAQPVVVQSWLHGDVSKRPPDSAEEWRPLMSHLSAYHVVTPDQKRRPLRSAVLTMRSARDGIDRIREQMSRIPAVAQPADLPSLLVRLEGTDFPTWPEAPRTLCRADPNTTNMIRRPGSWASVDWENSGWGDPAFDLADLVTHPAYQSVPSGDWEWILKLYLCNPGDLTLWLRFETYRVLTLVWWVARLARALDEAPRGADPRLAPRPASWREETTTLHQSYWDQANAALEGLGG